MMDLCDKCEELMQPYLDGVLSELQVREAKEHLDRCSWCAKRYKFEVDLRHFVRVAVQEPMPPELKAKLAALRTPLH
jgi:anti-sigma factor (TIGR02949 family)